MGNGASRDQEDIFDNEVNLFQFKLLRVIGRGSFGKVRMVERRETSKTYALKYISKAQVIKMDAVKNVLRERQILETLDHIFVVNMRFAFQDDEYMYMCMDLMMGGDLRFHLNRKAFGEDVVRFWVCELASAVTHLHSLGIVHRDIKPDNVLLDEYGHVHLTDFNIGCKLTPEKPVLTSQSGTVAYMAPEVFKGSGYGVAVDWWAVGIIFYEALYQKRPFQTENIADLKKAIQYQNIEYPEKEGVSRECVAAIRGFLNRDPNERLGIRNGMNGIKYHPFFVAGAYRDNVENWWQLLETKQLRPLFKPSSEHNNFDATYDLEELLLDDEPLTYRSTRKRALRMQKEKDRLMKEENARLKAEQEAAEAAFAALNLGADGHPDINADGDFGRGNKKKLGKKRSRLYLGGGGGDKQNSNPESTPSSTNGSRVYLGAPSSQTQVSNSPSSGHTPQLHSIAQLAQQTQFQSIPLSPIATSPGTGAPAVQFPTPPQPLATRHSSQHYRNLPSQPSPPSTSQARTHAPSPPTRPSSPPTTSGGGLGGRTGYTYSTSTGFGGTISSQQPGVTAIFLSKPAYGKGGAPQPHAKDTHPSLRSPAPHPDGPAPRVSQPPSRPPPPPPLQQQQHLSSSRSGDWRQEEGDDDDVEYLTVATTSAHHEDGDEDELQGIMTADEIMTRSPLPPPRASLSSSPATRGAILRGGTVERGDTSVSSPLSSSPTPSPTLGPQGTPPHNSLARPLPRAGGAGGGGGQSNAQHTREYHQLQQQVQQAHMHHHHHHHQAQHSHHHHPYHQPQQQHQHQYQHQYPHPQQQPQYGGAAPYKKASAQQPHHSVQATNHGNDDSRNPSRTYPTPMNPQHQQLLQQQLQQVYQVSLPPQQPQPSPAPPQPALPPLLPPGVREQSLKGKDKVNYMMALIEREFTTFDYTMYEKYGGVVDPLTMSVGDPPEWVRRK